jgi:citrate lyase beta subunit
MSVRPRRTLLYVPGDDWRKLQKAATLEVDCVCLDMEDGVALNRKQAARESIPRALETLQFRAFERLVRINAIGSGWEEEDLRAALQVLPEGIVVPKVEEKEQLDWIDEKLHQEETQRGLSPGSLRLWIGIETPRAILNLKTLAAHPRLEALIFGSEDLAAALGATRTPQGWEIFYARSAVVMAAAAFGLQAIDMVSVELYDTERIRAEALFGAQMGYSGKQIIHPNQIAPVREAFTPSPEAVAQAQRILEAYEAHLEQGKGAFALDGKMIDLPLVKAARNTLARAGKAPQG